MKRALPFVIIVIVLAAAVTAGFYLMRQPAAQLPPNSATSGASPAPSLDAVNEPGADPPHATGSADAPITLEEFGDFECPPCRLLHPILKTVEHDYGPKVRIIFREFPLTPPHEHAVAAARAAEAAGLQGKFWEMHDLLYDNQTAWHEAFDVRPIFEGFATKLGLDLERFRRDQTGDAVEDRIFRDGKRGHALGVKGTPTLFMNGREVPF
jgi:protein-disulfide isomerase